MSQTFSQLVKSYKDEDSAHGDFAQDLIRTRCNLSDAESIYQDMINRGACSEAVEVFQSLYTEHTGEYHHSIDDE